jgi:hypothetical protein
MENPARVLGKTKSTGTNIGIPGLPRACRAGLQQHGQAHLL